MTSKKLNSLMLSVPPATVAAETVAPPAPAMEDPAAVPAAVNKPVKAVKGATSAGQGRAAVPKAAAVTPAPAERDVPLQVVIPAQVRKQLALYCTARSESLRSVMLQAIRNLGIEVSDEEITGKRSRKNY